MALTQKIEFELTGKTETDLEQAFEEAVRRIREGNVVGHDSNDDGSFYFSVETEGEPDLSDDEDNDDQAVDAGADRPTSKLFETPQDLNEYLFRITDNGGQTADRYTVAFSDGSYLALSGSPSNPQGFSQWGEAIDPRVMAEEVENGEAVDLALGDLPKHIVEHILYRSNEGFQDYLDSVERRAEGVVATARKRAETDYGTYHDQAKSIYLKGGAFWIKRDGSPEDDFGPYETAREVILSNLPDQYSLAGDEYHSTEDVMRMEPSEEVLKKVADLEARRDAEWKSSRGW